MSDDDGKANPLDDLKQGLGLLLRAAKGAAGTVAEKIPAAKLDKLEEVAKDAVKEVGRAVETVGTELEKAVGSVLGSTPAASPPPATPPPPPEASAPPAEPFDDAYAPEPPKGPRV